MNSLNLIEKSDVDVLFFSIPEAEEVFRISPEGELLDFNAREALAKLDRQQPYSSDVAAVAAAYRALIQRIVELEDELARKR